MWYNYHKKTQGGTMKNVRISDRAYEVLRKLAGAEDRSMVKVIDRLLLRKGDDEKAIRTSRATGRNRL